MKAQEIVVREIKSEMPDIGEEAVIKAINVLCDKIVPALSVECDEPMIKSAATVLNLVLQSGVKKALIDLADKIDGEKDIA